MAITHSYVDYGAGNDTTGDGTIGTPWKTIQKALDTVTRDATNGNQINVKTGTAQVLAASLTLATYGVPTEAAPLILCGYTSAANDGGMGEIDCGGYVMWLAGNSYDYIQMAYLEMHTFGDNNGITLDDCISLHHCEIHNGASTITGTKTAVSLDDYARVTNCYFHGTYGNGINIIGPAPFVTDNYFVEARIYLTSSNNGNIARNIVNLTGNFDAIYVKSVAALLHIIDNVCYTSYASTMSGIRIDAGNAGSIINNIICGYSGAGGNGILADESVYRIGYNAFYNCTTECTVTANKFVDMTANDVTLAADPFTDAANGDFSLTAAAKTALADKGFPGQYLGAHANTVSNLNIGPIQMAAGGGSSIFRRVARLVGG